MKNYYQHHVFFCCNQRASGELCCNDSGASDLLNQAKDKIKALGLDGAGKIRLNKAGCLGRCEEGPVLVVYPEGIWYRYRNFADIETIIDEHLVGGKIVAALQLQHERS